VVVSSNDPRGYFTSKSLEEFDFDHARGLKRDTVAHLGSYPRF
jgi:hypothetical protein